jgi:hypothetical protein
MSLFFPLLMVPVVLIGLCAVGFWIWMLVDCLNNKNLSGSQRCCWAMFILFAHLIGAIVYYFARRPPQTTPIIPVYQVTSRQYRKPMQPEAPRPYQEGYPIQPFPQDERTKPEKVAVEQMPMQSQARYEDIQMVSSDESR